MKRKINTCQISGCNQNAWKKQCINGEGSPIYLCSGHAQQFSIKPKKNNPKNISSAKKINKCQISGCRNVAWSKKKLGDNGPQVYLCAGHAQEFSPKNKSDQPLNKSKPKKTERQLAEASLDRWFSIAMRLHYAAPETGYVSCCTCGVLKLWKMPDRSLHWGHFETRDKKSTRHDPKNGGPQCTSCNTYKHGRKDEMAIWIDKTHGSGTAEQLRVKSHIMADKPNFELRALSEYWRKEAKRIAKEKGLKL